VTACGELREVNFRSMQQAGISARDEARRGTRFVTGMAVAAVIAAMIVAIWLARSVLTPVTELTVSVEAIRQGDFDRRVKHAADDELGRLAAGFNRMAEALAEYRRSSLGELLASKRTLEATLNALPEAVMVIAPDGTLAALNTPAHAILRLKQAAQASRLADLPLTEEHRLVVTEALAGRPACPRPDFEDTFNIALHGRTKRFLLTAVPIPEFSREETGAVIVLNDVTEFARLDELRSELIAVASHELKSPLTALRMNLLMLGENSVELTPRHQQLLAAAVQGCEELAGTIEELLDMTRIEAGQLRLNLAPVNLEAVLATTGRGLQPRFDDAGVRLQLVRDGAPVVVLGDGARLGSVLANLLTNALKYSPAGGAVTVRLAHGHVSSAHGVANVGQFVEMTVADQGPGVPAEFRERIFEKFFRVEHHHPAQRSNGVHGTGIGLYLCREIVKGHGGSIVCGPGDGGGTRITIHLPVAL
jgi:two-component system, NtrC family, sensor histidine kinase KinB